MSEARVYWLRLELQDEIASMRGKRICVDPPPGFAELPKDVLSPRRVTHRIRGVLARYGNVDRVSVSARHRPYTDIFLEFYDVDTGYPLTTFEALLDTLESTGPR